MIFRLLCIGMLAAFFACYSKYWMAPENVRTVQFTGTLNPGETARELCDCMYHYIGQMGSNWLDGVNAACYVKCDDLTLELTGQPDPTYDPNVTDVSLDRPLEKLRGIFEQMVEADIVQLVCKPHCIEDTCGCIHCMLECPLNDDDRTIDVIYQDIIGYMNQNGWLSDSVSFYNQRGNNLEVEFVGNSDPEDNCEAPLYYTY